MSSGDRITGAGGLALRAAGALGRIARDRVDEAFGRALPRTPEQLADPQVLDELLARYAPPGAPPLPPVRRARLPGVRFESSNCTNFLIEVEFAGGRDPALPRSFYAKLPPPELATRAFANTLGFWEVEVGISKSDAFTPPGGTRFNYVAQGGAGVTRRLSSTTYLLAGLKWMHLSNNSLAGRGRNPDIEAVGPHVAVLTRF